MANAMSTDGHVRNLSLSIGPPASGPTTMITARGVGMPSAE